MAAKARDMDQGRLKKVLSFDPDTGVFRWLIKPRRAMQAGDVAGSLDKSLGYVTIRILGTNFMAHRLAWMYMTGDWPAGVVDHINGKRDDNRFSNLRDVSHRVNMENMRSPTLRSKSGLLGAIALPNGRFLSQIKTNGKSIHIGMYGTAEAAHAAYVQKKRQLHEGGTL